MKVACQKCNRVIDTNGDKKGNTAYSFDFYYDREPYINTSVKTSASGYLCFDCSRNIAVTLGYVDRSGCGVK